MDTFFKKPSFHGMINNCNLRFSFIHFTKRRSTTAMSFGQTHPSTLFIILDKRHYTLSFATHYDYFICNSTQLLYRKKNNAHFETNSLNYTKSSSLYYSNSTTSGKYSAHYCGTSINYHVDSLQNTCSIIKNTFSCLKKSYDIMKK